MPSTNPKAVPQPPHDSLRIAMWNQRGISRERIKGIPFHLSLLVGGAPLAGALQEDCHFISDCLLNTPDAGRKAIGYVYD